MGKHKSRKTCEALSVLEERPSLWTDMGRSDGILESQGGHKSGNPGEYVLNCLLTLQYNA